jgi:hypothetical protein
MAGFYKETQSLTNYNSVFFCVSVFFFVSLYPYKLKNRKKWMILENTLPSILV